MATRTTFNSATVGAVSGDDYMNNIAAHIKELYDSAAIALTTVAGTVNAVTAVLDPVLDLGTLVDGMKFTITWGGTNTGSVTLAINGGSAIAVKDNAGTALIAGALASGLRSLIEYIGGDFRILTPLSSAAGSTSPRYYQAFTASGTWTKPAGLDDDTMVFVEGWGGGGGGASTTLGGGGGGAAYMSGRFRLGDLASSIAVTIGAGGAVNGNGGNTTFGSLLTARGGGAATTTGGDGGGISGAGFLGGNGGAQGTTGGSPTAGLPGGSVSNEYGGAGGGGAAGGAVVAGGNGGVAVRGGGGGGGSGSGTSTGGVSYLGGGNGGNEDAAGSAPGGGGGRNAAGARGELRVWV